MKSRFLLSPVGTYVCSNLVMTENGIRHFCCGGKIMPNALSELENKRDHNAYVVFAHSQFSFIKNVDK